LVTISGEHQIATEAYTITGANGGTITFATAPPTGLKIEVLAIQIGAAAVGVNLIPGLFEKVNNQGGTAISATQDYDVKVQQILYFPADAGDSYVVNIRGDVTTTLNDYLAIDKALTLVLLVKQGSTTAYNLTAVTIDGAAVTVQWADGVAPVTVINTTEAYTLTIVKTGSAAYTVFGSAVKFA
jgi:uncharacterized protein GlcG (DUF336 family)